MAEITAVDIAERHLIVEGGHVQYDYLILAAGATHAYFGRDEWATIAPGLKSIEDATELHMSWSAGPGTTSATTRIPL